MLKLIVNKSKINSKKALDKSLGNKKNDLKEKVLLLIIRDLYRLGWDIQSKSKSLTISPPENYDKTIIKKAMAVRRDELIEKNADWISDHISLGRENLIDGSELLKSDIKPQIFVCKTQKEHDLFRLYRYYWSSPYSDYVGRRMRLIIRDMSLPSNPVIGIAALGSSIIHIPERDEWVGWDLKQRTNNIINTMDAYVIGALPPYNYILGGKLISYILTSNEVRELYKKKYKNKVTTIKKRKNSDLAMIFTTSLYGKSSQYNRLKYNKRTLFKHIGNTKGYGTLHLSEETFQSMLELLESVGINVTYAFGDGPSWRMRVIRTVGDLLGFDSDVLLQHSFKRSVYAIPLVRNYKSFLIGSSKKPLYYNQSLDELVNFWKERWLKNRKQNPEIIKQVLKFKKSDFEVNEVSKPFNLKVPA